MAISLSEEFKDYADFSVRVDRFFGFINIYGQYHDRLKFLYSKLPEQGVIQTCIDNDSLEKNIRQFLLAASNILNYMSGTNIFSDQGSISTENIWEDALNFSYYTCYCFQWTLFENFIKKMIQKGIDEGVFPSSIQEELIRLRLKTKQFLDFINSGQVFGCSPFIAILPVHSWVPKTETCDYSDLNKIRELRNKFIHGIETPEITTESIGVKHRQYERSMWILREFAKNIQLEIQNLLSSIPKSP